MVLSNSGRSPPPPSTNRRIRLSYGGQNNTTIAHDVDDTRRDSTFLAALSPATARYLRGDGGVNSRGVNNDSNCDNDDGDKMKDVHKATEDSTTELRQFVRSLLGISTNTHIDTLTTPDPSTSTFYALQLYSLTQRIDDAYLAARACALNNEEKRAVWILEGCGLLGGLEGDAAGGEDVNVDNNVNTSNDVASGDINTNSKADISNTNGIQASLQLRTESALLAGQCLIKIGETERALTVYSEAMRFPPLPPRKEWGAYGYGYTFNNTENEEGEEEEFNESYIRQWREQSLSNTALIDEGDDPRLFRLAENISNMQTAIHPLARLCTARGKAYDSLSNPHRALPFLKAALQIDPRCIEAWDYVIERKLLTPREEREWFGMLDWDGVDVKWLRDAYLIRLRGGGNGDSAPVLSVESNDESRIMDASSYRGVGLQTPSAFSLSPRFGGPEDDKIPQKEDTIDQAFKNLALTHHLGKSSNILALAAIRSYASHNLPAALTYCTIIDTLDPFCRTAGYVYIATLVGLNLKRRLFQLAHRLVDADPKDALAWFAVGSYYHICGRHDLSQRHFSRSTRLDPHSAECWIGFGCSFAICDESDQALASFRAAQNKYSGSHVPLLYMGMEYLRTNHLSLAGHFLTEAQRTDPSDALCCNELGVWAYRRGDLEDAVFWFVKALRLCVEAGGSVLTCSEEGLGVDGYVLLNSKLADGRDGTATPSVKRESVDDPPPSTVLCAIKTPSGQSIAAHKSSNGAVDSILSDLECVDRCKDVFREPTIYNLGQSYRKLQRYSDAIVCFEKCTSLNPGSSAAASALGFALHLSGDIDGAIDSYHEALSRKPDDPFSTEMLNRALAEAITYPKSSVFSSDMFTSEVTRQTSVIGRSIVPANLEGNNVEMGMI